VLVAPVTDSAILPTRISTSFAHQHNDACENARSTFVLRQSRMTDFVLVKVAQGNARAVRECIDQFGSLIWSIARRLTRTRADAEDAVQEIFTDIWRSAGRFDPAQGSEKVFVATIARRRLIDRLRRVGHRDLTDSIDDVESLTWSDPGTRAEVCAEAQTAARAVMQLRPEQRQVLELGLLQGLSHSEISEALKMPLGTVKTMMRRGLIQVRHLMGVEGDVAAEEAQS
jgi:RNA polymerase sigma-70 factor (ECF subfamily)